MLPQLGEQQVPEPIIQGIRCDGSRFDAEIGSVLLEVNGEMQRLTGVRDVSERLAAQNALGDSLREKEILLKEIHHRVKNNLQIISSLLILQSDQVTTDEARLLFRESVHRVRSMAMIHQHLYGVESLDSIDLGQYASLLATSLAAAFAPTTRLEVEASRVEVEVDIAVPLGLILNELITNACKYGLPTPSAADDRGARMQPDIRVEVADRGDDLLIAVTDSGPGLPDDFDVRNATTLGLQLVYSLCRQLRGNLSVSRDGGARFQLVCPKSS